ncbi:hypothetical protein [uncultured Secundilactobacillus sp.]|uniref:hypothetical protein n=1 Tax=uncultured Secundilactobacillus sp. TaxID=2813935 RepID=UPI0025877F65|nr:hypothetical protein [uncultured Secundilactobacillus sp.]
MKNTESINIDELTNITGGSAKGKGAGILQLLDWGADAVSRFKRDVKKYGNPTKV